MKAASVNGKSVPSHIIDRLEALSIAHSTNNEACKLDFSSINSISYTRFQRVEYEGLTVIGGLEYFFVVFRRKRSLQKR